MVCAFLCWGGSSRTTSAQRHQMPIAYSTGLIQAYKETYLNTFRAPFGLQSLGKSWRTVNDRDRYLTDEKVRAHLLGKYYVGAVTRVYTKYVLIDIDAHNGESQSEIWNRAERVMGAFGGIKPQLFNSPSGGMHLYYFFNEPVWQEMAIAYAKDVLNKAGIEVKKGYIEVLPAGKTVVRAPLGDGCFLLNPETMAPINSNRDECIRISHERILWHQIQRIEIPKEYNATATKSQQPTKAKKRRHSNQPNKFMKEVDDLIEYGLSAPNSRNEAFLKLSWYYRCLLAWDEANTIHQLWAWIQKKHNGLSNDFNTNPNAVYEHIKKLVPNTDPTMLLDAKQGANDSTYQMVRFNKASERVAKLGLREDDADLLANMICYAEYRGKMDGRGRWCVEIPYQTLKGWHWAYKTKLERLITKGYVSEGRDYSTIANRAREYVIYPCFV